MKEKGVSVRGGDVIPYILCLGGDGKGARSAQADNAFHPDDLRRQGSELKIDYDFYLDSQVLQPILRLCQDIEGTDRGRMAECLGLDPSRYSNHTAQVVERTFHTLESQITDSERFKEAAPLAVRCPTCDATFSFEGISVDTLEDAAAALRPTGVTCVACSAAVSPPTLAAQLEIAIRAAISKYYLAWTVCDGEGCGARTRAMGVYGRRCLGFTRPGCKGTVHLEYTDLALYNQLLYYRHLFDSEKALVATRGSVRHDDVRAITNANSVALNTGLAVVDKYLDLNGRRYVDMGGLFSFMEKIKL